MLKLFGKKSESQIVFVFDIGSSNVSGAIAKVSRGTQPEILYTTESLMKLRHELTPENFLLSATNALRETTQKLAKEGIAHLNFTGARNLPRSYFCFLSSPWAIFETKILKFEKESMLFTPALLQSIVGKEEDEFRKEAVAKYKAKVRENAVLLEKKVTDIQLNGYTTSKPFGKSASSATITLYLSMAGKDTIASFKNAISDTLQDDKKINFHTFSLAGPFVINDYLGEDDYTLLDITGEISDCLIISGGKVKEFASFPTAENNFVRVLARQFSTSTNETLSMLRMRNEGSLSQGMNEQVDSASAEYGKKFVDSFKDAVGHEIIGKIYIAANKEIQNEILKWMGNTPGVRPVILSEKFFEKYIKKQAHANVFLTLEVLFISKLQNNI
jgi:hypothetical protein